MRIKLVLPFNGKFPVTFGFGQTSSNQAILEKFKFWGIQGHSGVDFGLAEGIEVLASGSGKVIQAGENGDFGISVTIKHAWGESLYAHLKKTKLILGDKVRAGDLIGLSGKTGAAFGAHLHFAIKPNKPDLNNGYLGFIDPMPFFKK